MLFRIRSSFLPLSSQDLLNRLAALVIQCIYVFARISAFAYLSPHRIFSALTLVQSLTALYDVDVLSTSLFHNFMNAISDCNQLSFDHVVSFPSIQCNWNV